MLSTMLMGAAIAASPPGDQRVLDCEHVDRAIAASRDEPVPEPRHATDVQLSAHHSLCGGWEVIDIWQSSFREPVLWRARRKVMEPAGRLTVSTTDSLNCPALLPVLAKLDTVPVSLTVIPSAAAATRTPVPLAVTDGASFTLRVLSAKQGDGSTGTVTVSSDHGPLAAWAEAGQEQLKSCWRPST